MTEPPGLAAQDPTIEWLKAPRILVAVGSSTLTMAALYYFGFTYTVQLYEQIGVDAFALELGVHDYVIRSLNPVAPAVPWVVVVLLLLLLLYWWLIRIVSGDTATESSGGPQAEHRWRKSAVFVAAVLGAAGVAVRIFIWRGQTGAYFWLAGFGLLTWVAYLMLPDSSAAGARKSTTRSIALAGAVLFILAFVYGVFEVVRLHARTVGEERMIENETNCFIFPSVTIYSATDLHLEESGARRRLLEAGDGAMRYRYDNLRRFLHDNGRIIVWPADQPLRQGVILLQETDTIRIDTHPQSFESTRARLTEMREACPRLPS